MELRRRVKRTPHAGSGRGRKVELGRGEPALTRADVLAAAEAAASWEACEARLVARAERERVAAGAAEAGGRDPVAGVDAAGLGCDQRREPPRVREHSRAGVSLDDGQVLVGV